MDMDEERETKGGPTPFVNLRKERDPDPTMIDLSGQLAGLAAAVGVLNTNLAEVRVGVEDTKAWRRKFSGLVIVALVVLGILLLGVGKVALDNAAQNGQREADRVEAAFNACEATNRSRSGIMAFINFYAYQAQQQGADPFQSEGFRELYAFALEQYAPTDCSDPDDQQRDIDVPVPSIAPSTDTPTTTTSQPN